MSSKSPLLVALAICSIAILPAQAQQSPASRGIVPSTQALGMGNATVAFPNSQSALFYNPAHLTRARISRIPITLFGVSSSVSRGVFSQLEFFQQELEPALNQGLDNLAPDHERAIYEEAFNLGSTPSFVSGAILLPSFTMNRGNFGVGGGLFGNTVAQYHIEDAGGGTPAIDFAAIADLIAVGAGAYNLSGMGIQGLSVGVSGKYLRRYASLKAKPLDAFDEDESYYVLGDDQFSLDFGLNYESKLGITPGKLSFGLAFYEIALGAFEYEFVSYFSKNERRRDDDAIALEVARAQRLYTPQSSYRAGVAYVLDPASSFLTKTGIALDYVGEDTTVPRPWLAHFSVGVQTTLVEIFSLRAGLNQGYTTAGAGIRLPFMRIDYAFYGVEQGRIPGQLPNWNHRIQFLLGSF